MKITNWNDLYAFIGQMRPSERTEPVKIIMDDHPIQIAKEIDRAEDYYVRPKNECTKTCGYPQCYIEGPTRNWEQTMCKGDVFISVY
jgi:hypothetical protein